MSDDFEARTVDAFREIFGLTESEARRAVQGRDGPAGGFDRVKDMFQSTFGLSESAAEAATAGRQMGVSEARRSWDAVGSSGGSSGGRREPWQLAQEALDRMTDAECDQLVAEQRKRRTSAKKATAAKQPAGKRTATIAETSYPRGRR